MIPLLVAGVVAQGLDAATMELERELNPLVISMGSTAYLAKIALIVGVTALAWALPRLSARWGQTRRLAPRMASLLAVLLTLTGLMGFLSNTILPA